MNAPAQTSQTAVANRKPSEIEVQLAEYGPQMRAALPSHIPVERFKRTVLTAINANPDLLHADRRSLFLSCVRAAQDGLFPDGREAALVIFKAKDRKTGQYVDLVQYMPMIAGIVKRMRNSGDVSAVDTAVVYENDDFDFQLGDNPHILHKPTLTERGKPVGAYAIIKLVNGEVLREVMNVPEIEKVRAVSRAKDNGPWVSWWDEMARKTVLRRCSKRAPVSSDLDMLWKREDELATLDPEKATAHVSIPPKPAREQFAIEHKEEDAPPKPTFTVVSDQGEPVDYDEPAEAVHAMTGHLDVAERQGIKFLEGVWETNDRLPAMLREAGHAAAADALHADFTARHEKLSKGGTKPAPTQQAAGTIPPSPLTLKGKAQGDAWPAFCEALKRALMKADAAGKKALGEQYAAELEKIAEIRVSDHDAIQAILSA